MSDLSRFLKQNKKVRENVKYVATTSITDDKGNPLEWEIRPLTTKESDEIREQCTYQKSVKGKPHLQKEELDTHKYMVSLLSKSVVDPNLDDKTIQDSYGVMCREDLIEEMIDNPGEFYAFVRFITKLNGLDIESKEEKIEMAKN